MSRKESNRERNLRELDCANERGSRLGLSAPVNLRLERRNVTEYDLESVYLLINNLVKLVFALGMNSPDSPTYNLPSELFHDITNLNNFIYQTISERYFRQPRRISRPLSLTNSRVCDEPNPENTGGKRRRRRSKTRRRR